MLIALKNSNGANLQGELSHVIRQLQACSLTPGISLVKITPFKLSRSWKLKFTFVLCSIILGFVDIFSKTKDRLGAHASKILKFLHRNRIPSGAIPFPLLEGYNSICTMRSTVVQDYWEFLLQKEKGKPHYCMRMLLLHFLTNTVFKRSHIDTQLNCHWYLFCQI